MNIVAVIASAAGVAHTLLAVEALKRTAQVKGHRIDVEAGSEAGNGGVLAASDIAAADVVVLASDTPLDGRRFAGKPIYETRVSDVIRNTETVLRAALALLPGAEPGAAPRSWGIQPAQPAGAQAGVTPARPGAGGKRIVAITSCPTGIAHTFMAAEALQKAAGALGHSLRVETQGSVGAQNRLSPEEIAAADAVVVAAETNVDTSRFAGKPLYVTSTKHALRDAREVISTALEQPPSAVAAASEATAPGSARPRTGAYKHLMTGVSYMLPLVVAGGLAIALAFAVGGIYAGDREGTLGWALSQIGGGTALQLFVAVFSAFIAFSIADRPGIAPGLVGGMLAHSMGAGFLGGILSGFLAGYLTRWLAERIRLPATLEGLKPVLILPFLSTVTVGLLMIFVIGPPVQALNNSLTAWLTGLTGANAALLGLILGGMMAFDMGGPLNKAAYTFAVGLLASQIYTPMAAVMAAGMTPPLGLALAVFLFRDRFDVEERRAAGPAGVLGLSFITEGAIPFAAKDPLRIIPALILGSAAAGAISMVAGVQLLVPHGGIFAAVIPGAVTGIVVYLVAILTGTAVTTVALWLLNRPLPAAEPVTVTGTGAAAAAGQPLSAGRAR
jgi:fructose PTS system EIIBC or EIIC component